MNRTKGRAWTSWRIFAGVLILVLSTLGNGCLYLGLSGEAKGLQRLTDQSDFIAVGTLVPVAPEGADTTEIARGLLSVRNMVWGDPIQFMLGPEAFEMALQVTWPPDAAPPLGSDRLFFLGAEMDGTRSVISWADPSRQGVALRQLMDQMVLVRQVGMPDGSAPVIELLVRNAHPVGIELPEFRMSGGMLQLHPQVNLHIAIVGADELLEPVPGRLVLIDESELGVLLSGEEKRVRINLADILGPAATQPLRIRFEIGRYGHYELDLPGQP